MEPFIANTDERWFDFLSRRAVDGRVDEGNCWSPRAQEPMKAMTPGEPVFVRLKRPEQPRPQRPPPHEGVPCAVRPRLRGRDSGLPRSPPPPDQGAWNDGKRFYAYEGAPPVAVPRLAAERPRREALAWHMESVFAKA